MYFHYSDKFRGPLYNSPCYGGRSQSTKRNKSIPDKHEKALLRMMDLVRMPPEVA